MKDPRQPDEGEPQAPARLVHALQGLYGTPPEVPPAVDDAILANARRHFQRQRQRAAARSRPGPLRVWPRWLAAAAVLTLAAWPAQIALRKFNAQRLASLAHRADVDRNGRVDIRDALALARRIETRTAPAQQFDLNGDGIVDRRDVDAIALQAVKLDRRTG